MDSEHAQDNSLTILLTGGHAATTAIATIEQIRKTVPAASIAWIGAKNAISGSKVTTLEYKIYPNMGVKYYEIKAGKLQTKFTRYTIPLMLMIPVGFLQALMLLIKIRPKVILSFGGFASFPVVFWGWFLNIPVVLHEQTMVAGRAALASVPFCKKIAISRIESQKFFPVGKTILTGNPLMTKILEIKPKHSSSENKTILIMGGSRGSEFINEEIEKVSKTLIARYKLIHITGERDFEKYKHLEGKNYQVIRLVNPLEMSKFYDKCDLIVSRSGANTVSEILYIKRPAIFIPLPRTFMDEQTKNAKYAESLGLAKVLVERDVTEGKLTETIDQVFDNWESMVRSVDTYKNPDGKASERLTGILLEYIC